MIKTNRYGRVSVGGIAGATLAIGMLSVQAQVLNSSWTYQLDSFNDASPFAADGSATWDYKGIAAKLNGGKLYLAVNGNLGLGGSAYGGSRNGTIANGDLFLNFSGHSLDTPGSYTGNRVFAVRFDAANDSLGNTTGTPVTTLGVYNQVSVVSLATQNSGYSSLADYVNYIQNYTSPTMGPLNASQFQSYLGTGSIYANISSGTEVEGITSLDSTQLAAAGLNFAGQGANGSATFGFSMDLNALGLGAGLHPLTAHLFTECGNDGLAMVSSVPEPAETAGAIGLVAAAFVWFRRRNPKV